MILSKHKKVAQQIKEPGTKNICITFHFIVLISILGSKINVINYKDTRITTENYPSPLHHGLAYLAYTLILARLPCCVYCKGGATKIILFPLPRVAKLQKKCSCVYVTCKLWFCTKYTHTLVGQITKRLLNKINIKSVNG